MNCNTMYLIQNCNTMYVFQDYNNMYVFQDCNTIFLLQDPLRYVLFSDGSMESARALQYFSINPDNGLITVSKDLQTDTTKAKVYNVQFYFKTFYDTPMATGALCVTLQSFIFQTVQLIMQRLVGAFILSDIFYFIIR